MRQATTRVAATLAMVLAPVGAAMAQPGWVPGSEIVGQTLQVQTNGVTNNVYLGANGQATITTAGGKVVPASWSAAGGQLCLSTGGPQECWPYRQAFQPGMPVAAVSNCNAASTWVANSTNQPLQQSAGERG